MKTFNLYKLLVILLFLASFQLYAEEELSIDAAIEQALEQDLLIKSHLQKSQAFDEYSVAVDTWADPKIKLGVMSLPVDSMELDQEPMTQMILGYQQMLPRGDMTKYESASLKAKARGEIAQLDLRKRQVIRQVSNVWLNVYLHEQSEKIIQKNRRLFRQQLNVSQSLYASGRNQQQDVLQAELELSLLDDQLQKVTSKINESRAILSRWIGPEKSTYMLKVIEGQFSQSPGGDVKKLINSLAAYPLLQKYDASEMLARENLEMAKQKYKPQWGFEVTYGSRSGDNMDGSERSDFVSTMVNFDLPVFTNKKQDRELSARKMQLQASKYEKQDIYLQVVSQLEEAFIKWQKLNERVNLYDRQVLRQAKQNARAALNGYQSGVVSFFTLTRARSAELKAELQRLNLLVEQAMVAVDIHYLTGDK
ncbi:MAG: TolC family protein [Gammaproteobacteria bacterium]|nr:TolC family protein [Gammaproteobacteria bacterium]